jgi:signal transduction histidine kinase
LRLRFAVIDSGIGIKSEDFTKLFKVFGNFNKSRNDDANTEGIGLGLTICNRILNQFRSDSANNENSHLQVKSRYGEGSEFYFYLNVDRAIELSDD